MMRNRRLAAGIVGIFLIAALDAPVWGQDALFGGKINDAIEKGVAYVKSYTETGGTGTKRPASWALRGWALLEAGVPAGDVAVKKIVDYVRQEVPEMDEVYD